MTQYFAPALSRLLGLVVLLGGSALAQSGLDRNGTDPLDSPMWANMHERFLAGEDYVFDTAIEVTAPSYAEDSLNVPVAFSISGIENIQQIAVFADLNPLPMVLRLRPVTVAPAMAFRFKLQQSSPVRVAALTDDGLWHVGSAWIDAAGGGCTAPSVGMASGNWTETFGTVNAGFFPRETGNRLKLQIMHPMDTGLAEGIPRFHIEQLQLRNLDDNSLMAELELYEPISENPLLSFDVGAVNGVTLKGHDNNANTFAADLVNP